METNLTIAGLPAAPATVLRLAELRAAAEHGAPVVADYVAKDSDNAAGARVFIVLEIKQKIDNAQNRRANTVGDYFAVTAICDGHGAVDLTINADGAPVVPTRSRTPQSFASEIVLLDSDQGQAKVIKANLV